MTSPSADPQHVEQIRSDLSGAYEILTDVNAKLARHTALHAEHTARFDGLDAKVDRVLEILEAS